MRSSNIAEREAEIGVRERSLYVRGRLSATGTPSLATATQVFGIFPEWFMKYVLRRSRTLTGEDALRHYSEVCWEWGERNLPETGDEGALARTLLTIADRADAGALPLFAGWRSAPRPESDRALLAHALMLVRELRGGLHFAALRVHGLDIPLAIVADRFEGGRARLLRSGWSEPEVDELMARAEQHPDLHQAWKRAEDTTNRLFGEVFVGTLTAEEFDRLTVSLSNASEQADPA
uniref:helix-turn-helix domain-containing protein n=1 Tax=Nocardiopsis halotolerans TaxID=124252 RepID=UPI001F4C5A28|nr:hypothetical protein [Nocardiopsis halotolerans]